MFALGLGTIAIAMTGDIKLWTIYVSVVLLGAKIAAFAIQYVAFRVLVTEPHPRGPRRGRDLRRFHARQSDWAWRARWAIPRASRFQ